jgi:NAD(P)-dependent dehydrogenase (short-subunit alcohol dehydrogenase family)
VSDTIAVVTGANSGLGYQTALALARSGATVVMACRSAARAQQAQADLQALLPTARTELIPLDLSEPESIRSFGDTLAARCGGLDLLINNAGVVAAPLAHNSAGHEMHLATNYLGAFALTGTLLPLFRDGTPARIVNVGSLGHRLTGIDLDDLNWQTTSYNPWKAYFRSKLAIVSFTLELDRRLRRSGSSVLALGAHPGFAATDVAKKSSALAPTNAFGKWLQDKISLLIPSPADAARPIVHAACDADVRGGDYYGPGGFLEIRGDTARARVNRLASDAEVGGRLWALSESMTGVRYLSAS